MPLMPAATSALAHVSSESWKTLLLVKLHITNMKIHTRMSMSQPLILRNCEGN